MSLCECGKCGKETKPGKRYVHGHNKYIKSSIEVVCETCGKKFMRVPSSIFKRIFCFRQCTDFTPSIEQKRKNSESNKKTFLERQSQQLIQPQKVTKFSKQEQRLAPVMKSLGFKWNTEDFKAIKCNDRIRVPDFYNPDTKEIIEVFGYWWHRDNPKIEHETPEYVIEQYALVGWKCKVYWDDEFEEFCNKLKY